MQKLSSEWNLNQWLYSLENRNTQEIQLGLTRTLKVASKLNLQVPDCKVITVTGTNGKGSTVTALETIYHMAGYQVGAYTSPHLIHFNERIRVNKKNISDEDICLAFSVIEEARDEVVLTYFEMTTLAALWHFKQHSLDVMIIEVGIGGRLDATNIIDSDVSVITTVDFDHQEYLGSTLDAIGYEKAGILRKGRPCVYADANPPSSILEEASKLEASCFLYGKDYFFEDQIDHWEFNFLGEKKQLPKPHIQLKSASAALVVSSLLNDQLPVDQEHLFSAMQDIFIPGRLQLFRGTIDILYDVSHNPQSARLLADTIRTLNIKSKVHAVFSALKDKDIFGLIMPLKDCVNRWYPAQLDNKRAPSESLLLSKFRDAEIPVDTCYNSPLIAFEAALKQAEAGDLIIVYGSFFTVSHVMTAQHVILEQGVIQ